MVKKRFFTSGHCGHALSSPDAINRTNIGEIFILNDAIETAKGNNRTSNFAMLRFRISLI